MHPSSRHAASAGRIASATSQWVAAGLVLSRRCSEWSSRGGIGVLTRGVSSTLLVFLIAIALRVHILFRPEPPATGPPSAAITPRACPAVTAPSPAAAHAPRRSSRHSHARAAAHHCRSQQDAEHTASHHHKQWSRLTLRSQPAIAREKQRETRPLHHAQQQMAAPRQQRTHHETDGISTIAELAHRTANQKLKKQ
ncbi:hypothetical protein TcCL_NonESM12438 [Trypanosoma cruzi]|nr:hypothetical protein TcCL_NonESM12438 [Trypanosoma cruzi]